MNAADWVAAQAGKADLAGTGRKRPPTSRTKRTTSRSRQGAQPNTAPKLTPVTVGHPLLDGPATLRIVGTPRTQGSKQALVRKDGTVFMREGGNAAAHESFKSWRHAVAAAGSRWLQTVGFPAPFDGPVRIDALFLLYKPPSRPKSERMPRTGLDRDKLERALHDGLSVDAPILANDSRICVGEIGKLWAVGTTPGAVVRIEAVDDSDWRRFPLVGLVWPD